MIVVDVETTGLNPKKHSIASIGAVDFQNPNKQFYEECKIWSGAEIMREALDVNGFTEEELRDPIKKPLKEVMREFLEWTNAVEDKTIGGENPSFDRDFLIDSAKRYGFEWPLGYRTDDLHTTCRNYFRRVGETMILKNGRTDLNLDKILNYVGLPSEPKPHNALVGAKMETEAFSRLINRSGIFPEYEIFEIPKFIMTNQRKYWMGNRSK
jgi:DNA polymerase III epsilon subunit-like protein